jgi:hypothetical protein
MITLPAGKEGGGAMSRDVTSGIGHRLLPSGVEAVIVPRAHDVGGFEVHRALPAKEKQMIGPFIFFDQMGPGEFLTGQGLDIRPHPHIGLATVTYLFDGSILHRDSLGTQLTLLHGSPAKSGRNLRNINELCI